MENQGCSRSALVLLLLLLLLITWNELSVLMSLSFLGDVIVLRFALFSVRDDGTSSDLMYTDSMMFLHSDTEIADKRSHHSKCGALLLVPDSWWSYLPLESRSHSELEVTVIRA